MRKGKYVVPITTNVTSSNLAQAIQHYVIKFASDLWQVRGFLGPLRTTELNIVELDTYGNYRDRTLHNRKNILYLVY
jgi:hypothetical protein